MTAVFDPVRRRNIRATPEEIVRQLWINYFLQIHNFNPKLIAIERSFTMQGMKRRFDLVLFDKSTQPILLAEFKAPGVSITQSTFDQIAMYNMQWHVPFTLVSNGISHYCFRIDDDQKGFFFLEQLPALSS